AGKLVGCVSADIARLGKDAAAQDTAGPARHRKEERARGGGAGAVDRQAAIHVAERALEARAQHETRILRFGTPPDLRAVEAASGMKAVMGTKHLPGVG